MNQMCKVCGEPAAGFHFGAFTCEGCKSFFGRSYNNIKSISDCKNGGMCVINKKNRTSCKACRLRKCMLVGMSKSGSRYGRRSNWFKMTCILEEHQRQQQLQHEHGRSLLVEHARESLAASRGEEGSSDEYNRSSSVSSRGSPNSSNSIEVSEGRDAYFNSNFRALQPHIPGASTPLNNEILRLPPGFPLNKMPFLPPPFPLPLIPPYAGFYSSHGAHSFLQNSYSHFQTAIPAFGNAENFSNPDGDHLTSLINIKRKYCVNNSRVLSEDLEKKIQEDSRVSSPANSEHAPQDNPIDLSMKQSSDCSDEEVDLEDSDSDSVYHAPTTQNPIDLTTPR